MTDTPVRIDGWKSIAAYFGRDRTTVMRWSHAPGFPVHRIAGRGNASVYAYAHELDSWLARGGRKEDEAEPPPSVSPIAPAPADRRERGRLAVLGAALLTIAGILAAPYAGRLMGRTAPAATANALPADPELAAVYLQARDDWASRTAEGLHRAVTEFGLVASRDPKFAPAYSGLADAYLLIREYDALPDAKAYPQAEAAAKAALAIDPNCPDANRALAFVDYYWRHDNAAARKRFQRALALDPENAQTHFWYGNALVNNGEVAAGLKELDTARLRDPGSVAIRADYAWALWLSGDADAGKAALRAVEHDAPASVSAHAYLAYVDLIDRDFPGYLAESAERARLRGDAALASRVALQSDAYARGGSAGLLDTMRRQAAADRAGGAATDSDWEVLLAGLSGDRPGLLRVLQQADAKGEHWGVNHMLSSALAPWSTDKEIMRLVARRRGEPLTAG